MPAKAGFKIQMDMKSLFFDRTMTKTRIPRSKRATLAKWGAYVRKQAKGRKVLARKKGPSLPGRPPHVHAKGSGAASLRHIYFVPNYQGESVIIGPVRLPGVVGKNVPHVLQFGGRVGWRGSMRRGPYIRARPYMNVALDLSKPHLAKIYAECHQKYWN